MDKQKHRIFSEPFKLEVLSDYYLSGMCKSFTYKKFNISGALLNLWIIRYQSAAELLPLIPMHTNEKSKEELLEEQILHLQQALKMEKLRSRAFEKLIEITEQAEGISILKKGGVKQ